jgi:hypothetical protein
MASPISQAPIRQVYELRGEMFEHSNHPITSMIAVIYEDKSMLFIRGNNEISPI